MRAHFGVFCLSSVACSCGNTMLGASSRSAGMGMVIAPPRQFSGTRLIRRRRETRSKAWDYERLRRRIVMPYLAAPMTTRAERGAAEEAATSNSKKIRKEMKKDESKYKVSNVYGLCNGM